MRFDEEAWNRWREWMEVIHRDLELTLDDHAIFSRFHQLVQSNQDHICDTEGGYFIDYIYRAHADRACMGIRRHVKVDDQSVSLRRLLNQLASCAGQIGLEFYHRQFPAPSGDPDWPASVFGKLSIDGSYLSKEIVEQDLDHLALLAGEVEEYADRVVAHVDLRGSEVKLTLEKFDAAMNALDELACRYRNFLTGEYYSSLRSTVLFDWTKILREPMFPSESFRRESME